VERYEIGNVDLLRDSADITVHYRADHRSNKPGKQPAEML
jgi:hypothetical protein